MDSYWSDEEQRLYDIYVAAIGTPTEDAKRRDWMVARKAFVADSQG